MNSSTFCINHMQKNLKILILHDLFDDDDDMENASCSSTGCSDFSATFPFQSGAMSPKIPIF